MAPLITGFLFGTTVVDRALPGRERSGAHINPIVTLAFRLMGKLDLWTSFGYVVAQLAGAILGSLPLLAWGAMGRSVCSAPPFPAKVQRRGRPVGEVVTTFAMVTLMCVFLGFRRIRPFTPAIFPVLYAVMVYAESPISGTSTNPARSLGPAIISGRWEDWWIYWVGPVIGSVAACLACSALAKRITVAKLYHFDSDRDRLFRKASDPSA